MVTVINVTDKNGNFLERLEIIAEYVVIKTIDPLKPMAICELDIAGRTKIRYYNGVSLSIVKCY